MSEKSTEWRLREIQAQMNQQQDAVLDKVGAAYQQIERIADSMQVGLQTVQENQLLMKTAMEQEGVLLSEVSQLARSSDTIASQQVCQAQLQELREHLDGLEAQITQFPIILERQQTDLKEQLKGIAMDIHEIRTGDIFCRIESIQGKQVRLENTLQRNLLSIEDQMHSEEYAFISRMRALFPVQQVVHDGGFVRIGRAHDGGYVMLNDFSGSKIAYSIGIADDVSWDQNIADLGFDVYMYDHTIQDIPYHADFLHYFNIGLGAKSDPTMPHLKTLSQMMAENDHWDDYNIILKIDIEGAEWDFLIEVDEKLLTHFSQIVFEFHGLILPENESKIKSAMDKLNKTHQLVHLHPNNYGDYLQIGGKVLPELIEGTYLLRSKYQFFNAEKSFPTQQDEANAVYLPDIYLGNWDTEK